jgi:hypothetical protein
MLCIEKCKTYSTTRYIRSNLFHSHTVYHKLWYNFGGSSSYTNKVFIIQKKVIRIIMNTRPRDSCREVFKNMEIVMLHSQYIYSLILYTANNKYLFSTNNEIHKYRTRYNNNLHLPIANLSKFHKGAYIYQVLKFPPTFLNV